MVKSSIGKKGFFIDLVGQNLFFSFFSWLVISQNFRNEFMRL